MISYLTEVDLKKREVHLLFRGRTTKFIYGPGLTSLNLRDSLKEAAEAACVQITAFTEELVEKAQADSVGPPLPGYKES